MGDFAKRLAQTFERKWANRVWIIKEGPDRGEKVLVDSCDHFMMCFCRSLKDGRTIRVCGTAFTTEKKWAEIQFLESLKGI